MGNTEKISLFFIPAVTAVLHAVNFPSGEKKDVCKTMYHDRHVTGYSCSRKLSKKPSMDWQ